MFVVVEFAVDGKPIKATEAENAGKALKMIEDPLAINQMDTYKVQEPGMWELMWWKAYGTGMPIFNNKTRRRGSNVKSKSGDYSDSFL